MEKSLPTRGLTSTKLGLLFAKIQRFNEARVLYAIRNGFIAIMPVVIIGAFATAVISLPIPAFQSFMAGTFGETWTMVGSLVESGTTKIIAVLMVLAICINLGAWHNKQRRIMVREGICGMVGLACFTIMSIPVTGFAGLPTKMTGVTGMFVGMVVAVCATELFVSISTMRKDKFTASDDPNFAVPQSFNAVLPAAYTILLFVTVRLLLVAMGYTASVNELLEQALRLPFQNVSDSILSANLYNLATHVLWLFGIHGTNVLDDVAQNVFALPELENIAAHAAGTAAPHLVTKTLFDAFVWTGGAGCTLALLVALMLFGRRSSYRQLFRFSLPTAIFNINEPLIFGVPIVLNPLYAIPFVLTPVVMLGTTTLAMGLGLVPYTIAKVTWSTPIFISGYLATGSVAGVLLQVFNLVLATFIYAPFVRLSEQMMDIRFQNAYGALSEYVVNEYDGSQRLLQRVDELGAVARKLGTELPHGWNDGSMFLVYQPIVDARTGTLHSMEALLRWNSRHNGFINPMVTVALAEETGMMDELGLWIMEQAIAQRAEWNAQGLQDFHVSVNVSPHQLEKSSFHRKVEQLLKQYGVPPSQLQVEITETAALVDNEATRENLALLARRGVTLAMDDFGVGHSSLLYLRTQPITTLKIDASLSTDIIHNPASLNILITIRDLCRLLEVETIVEHVDNEKQLQMLLEVDAYLIQGYYFSPPLPATEIPGYLAELHKKTAPVRS